MKSRSTDSEVHQLLLSAFIFVPRHFSMFCRRLSAEMRGLCSRPIDQRMDRRVRGGAHFSGQKRSSRRRKRREEHHQRWESTALVLRTIPVLLIGKIRYLFPRCMCPVGRDQEEDTVVGCNFGHRGETKHSFLFDSY